MSEWNVVFFSLPAHKIGGKRTIPKPSPSSTASDGFFPRENWIIVAATGMTGKNRPITTQGTCIYFIRCRFLKLREANGNFNPQKIVRM